MITLDNYSKEEVLAILEERDALLDALKEMTSVAQSIDGHESFPSAPLDKAVDLLVSLGEY